MTRQRLDSLDPAFAGAFGAREEGAMPARAESAASPTIADSAKRRRTWLRVGLRVVRDAAIAVAFMTMVPVAIVAVRGEAIWRNGEWGTSTRARLALMERVRPFVLPSDPSITPTQAGLAFAALQGPPKYPSEFVLNEPVSRPAMSWRDVEPAPGAFANAFNNLYHGPSSEVILEAAHRGFSPEEMKYLRTLATAPAWHAFDIVARAPAADLLGGRFQLPFPAAAGFYTMPSADFRSTKEMAYAGVSRAAYHMSIGQRDSAETILRAIISFGFVLGDNGTTLLDGLIGNIIVGVGRDGLKRFYTITNDPRANSPGLIAPKKEDFDHPPPRTPRRSVDEIRRKFIATAGNASLAQPVRFEALTALSASSCTNVRELMFGRRQETDDAIARARRDLARYPSERELVNLIGRFNLPPLNSGTFSSTEKLAVSASAVAGTVLRNPRLAVCSRLIGTP